MAEDSSDAEEEEEEKAPPCEKCKPGAPLWMATFADMATLLMAFFVLLLSFADTKVDKYKKVVGSLSNAFGMPTPRVMIKGTSLIEQEFSPSITQATVINTPSQRSKDSTKSELELKQETDEKDSDIKSELKRLQRKK
jgi:chemotaxis protein MotB